MSKKYSTIHYHSYLKLNELLGAQELLSAELDENPAHEEMLFIIIHQVYELWFKQIIHELRSVIGLFAADKVNEKSISTAVGRLQRVEEIQKLLIKQIDVLETMTPLDFLDFRNYLFPASGFQSFQFRVLEKMLGLRDSQRITYNNYHYTESFNDEQKAALGEWDNGNTLFEVIEAWLERTPFLQFNNFDFLGYYSKAVKNMLQKEEKAIQASSYLKPHEIEMRIKMLKGSDSYFDNILDPVKHEEKQKDGILRLSYKATLGALLINLYRDEPILHLPFQLLINIVEIDELFASWRHRHAQMVLRMLGRKVGTGGSSGHEYLSATARNHKVFTDLHNVSTLLIPRSELPPLPEEIRKELGFYHSQSKKA